MRWGLVPSFAKSAADFKVFSTINAKAETLQEKAIWQRPFERHRSLVPADGLYEWLRLDPKKKQPRTFREQLAQPAEISFSGVARFGLIRGAAGCSLL